MKIKTTLIYGIAILLIGASILPTAISIYSEKTIYVDDDNTQGPWDGTIKHPYQYIQDGIDAANSGDTIYVFNGTYYENVIVYKTINLVGENNGITIIDGKKRGDIVYISADKVTITGFTIKNSGPGDNWDDAGVDVRSNYNTIKGNRIYENWHGIHLEYYSCYNTISENEIVSNDYFGIHINSNYYLQIGSSNNEICGNDISKNDIDGICCYYGHSNKNKISGNKINDNDRYGIGLRNSCNDNVISENVFAGNDYGIELYSSTSRNTITENTFKNCYGIGIHASSTGNLISKNHFDNSTIEIGSRDVTIIDNSFTTRGISFVGFDDLSIWNTHTIRGNLANGRPIRYYKNTDHVIVPRDTAQLILANCDKFIIKDLKINSVDQGIQLGFSSYNTIDGNIVDKIRLSFSSNNEITGNTITSEVWDYEYDSIYLRYSSNNIISDNILKSGGDIETYSSSYNMISENIISNGGTIRLYWDVEGNTIANNTITNNIEGLGIYLRGPSDTTINGNKINNTDKGILLHDSDNNILYDNHITYNNWGIRLHNANSNTIYENSIAENTNYGISTYGINNKIYHNNFISNQQHASDAHNNIWDNGYPSGGNYWDDYTGYDNFQGPNQDIPGSDGIGDTPYNIPCGNSQDNYPLMNPVDMFPPLIVFQTSERQLKVKLGEGIGGPGDERLDIWTHDDTTPNQDIKATLYVKGLYEGQWSLIKPMTYIRELHRGNITSEEIENYYNLGHKVLLYKVTAMDEAGNIAERPSSDEDPLLFSITIVD